MIELPSNFVRAAKGDIEAQSALLDHAVMTALQPDALRPEFLAVIELLARLLAAHGLPEHQRRLAGVLLFKGSMNKLGRWGDLCKTFIQEGTAILRQLAKAGDDRAASQLAELTRRIENDHALPAEIMLGDAAPTSH